MDSDEYSTDENKRKRGEKEEDENIFNRSKKTNRSPIKEKRREEIKMDRMLDLLQKLSQDMEELKIDQRKTSVSLEKINNKIIKITEENERIKKENQDIKDENNKIKEELRKMSTRMEQLDKEKRANNIVIQGIEMDAYKVEILKEAMARFIKDNLEIEVTVQSAHKIGSKTCLVKLDKFQDKLKVMQNKNKLKRGSAPNIYINNDLTKYEMEIQKIIKVRAREEKEKGRTAKIGYKKIEIEGKKWIWDETRNRLEEMKEVENKVEEASKNQ